MPGVADPELLGGQKFAMRIWLDPNRAWRHLNISAVQISMWRWTAANNYLAAAGSTKGFYRHGRHHRRAPICAASRNSAISSCSTRARSWCASPISPISSSGPQESSSSSVYVNGDKAGLHRHQDDAGLANVLTVISDVRDMLPKLESQLAAGRQAAGRL